MGCLGVDRDRSVPFLGPSEGGIESFQVLLQLEGRVKLESVNKCCITMRGRDATCESGSRGGPAAMSAALVPGRIRRAAA